jgi:hypothetical protein
VKSVNELIVEALQKEFNYNMLRLDDPQSFFNVWVMAVAVTPFAENEQNYELLPYRLDDISERERYMQMGVPTHIAKLVCRTTVYFIVDLEQQTAKCGIWDETWNDGNPLSHGETMTSAFRWLTKSPSEIIFMQLKDLYMSGDMWSLLNKSSSDFCDIN